MQCSHIAPLQRVDLTWLCLKILCTRTSQDFPKLEMVLRIELVVIFLLKMVIAKILPDSCGKQSRLFMAEMTKLSCVRGGNKGWSYALGWKVRTPQLAAPTGSG